jgi:hypothetical protein
MPFVMENHKPPDPTDICFFGSGTIVPKPDGASDSVQQPLWLWLTRRIAAFHEVRHRNSRTILHRLKTQGSPEKFSWKSAIICDIRVTFRGFASVEAAIARLECPVAKVACG